MKKKIILTVLVVGVLFRLLLTWDGNFLFNMDNARDMVDVREMVVLHKIRLTGPSSAIEGIFNGPAWYYFLAIPFILSGGDPYGAILMEILFWAIGGFFLLKMVSTYGKLSMITVGSLWVASNYVVLTNLYAFNPNPVILLTPFFIYLFKKYLDEGKLIFSVAAWFLAGLFFNFEMNFGVFMPVIIVLGIYFSKHLSLLKAKNFWIGGGFFVLTLLPQALFDLRHEFIMTNSLLDYFKNQADSGGVVNPILRILEIAQKFYDSIGATFMNSKLLTNVMLISFFFILFKYFRKTSWKEENTILIALLFIFVPFLGYILIQTAVNSWHLGGVMAAVIVLTGFILNKLKFISIPISLFIIFLAIQNITSTIKDFGKPNLDPSLYKNEIAAIDYVYKYAKGKNFKVYTYLPSVYDYPYQYLFWWYGQKEYGYIPGEYAYSPGKPQYIPSQDKFSGSKDNFSGLVFLIKEPNRNFTRFGWEGDFIKYNWQTIEKQMVGPIEIEIRKE